MIMNLIPQDHQLLKTNLEPFDFKNPPIDPVELTETMIENLEHYRGLGLSANQIGLPYRVFVINTQPEKLVCFNPEITFASEEMKVITEGCLTFPSLYVKIRRPSLIRAKFFDQTGEIKTMKLDDIIGRCYQHELDHLNGVDYLSRATPYHLSQSKRKAKIINRKIKKMQRAVGA